MTQPSAKLESVVQWLMATAFLAVAIRHFQYFEVYLSRLLWLLEFLLLLGLCGACILRKPLKKSAKGFREWWIPPLGAILPFFLIQDPASILQGEWPRYRPLANLAWYDWLKWVMILGTGLTLWALWHLRGSFSILVEARERVFTGPYRIFSHPMYVGEVVTATASAALRGGLDVWGFWFLFLLCQILRARMEHEKLLQAGFGLPEEYGEQNGVYNDEEHADPQSRGRGDQRCQISSLSEAKKKN